MDLPDRHVIVTGGASGAREATARRLADAGAIITIVDRNADASQRAASKGGIRLPPK